MAEQKKRVAKRLSAAFVRTAGPGFWPDGDGLYLKVDGAGNRRWAFLSQRGGKRRELGGGSARDVPLAQARAWAQETRRAIQEGRDPKAEQEAAKKAEAGLMTFGQAADALIAAKEPEWRNDKHKAQWRMTLTHYAKPLRSRPVAEIDTEAVLAVLQPLWLVKPETAARLRGRIEATIDFARAKGAIPHDRANPARWKGHLSHLLSKRAKLSRGHHAAMPYAELPAFMARLREREATAAAALELTILCATRSGEVLGARWEEIDLEQRIWTIPAQRMKAAREHRVPLSERAVAILKKLEEMRVGDYLLPGQRADKPLSNMAMEIVLRRMNVEDVTVHGFRSSFRDWAGNETHFPRELAEAALAHIIGNAAEQAYRRSDALEKRRALMEEWSRYCEPKAPNVVSLPSRKSALAP